MRVLRRLSRAFFVWVTPVLVLLLLGVAVVSLPEAELVDRQGGVRGTFTAEREQRDTVGRSTSVTFYGTFRGDDGTTTVADVPFDGDVDKVGQEVPAQYVKDSMSGSGVTSLDPGAARDTWLVVAVLLAYLGWWVWAVLVRPRLAATPPDRW